MMKLTDLLNVLLCDFVVGVSNDTAFVEEFDATATEKRVKYKDAVITGVHVLNEDVVAINVDIGK